MALSGVGSNVVKHILPTFSEAVNMVEDRYSSFEKTTTTRHITLPPKYLGRLKAGVSDLINADLGLYSDRLGGVMIAYSNMKMYKPTGSIMDDQAFVHFNVQLDEVIFKPTVGCLLKGVVNKKGENYIGCLVHGCFNASIPKPKLNDWKGFQLELGDDFLFSVTRVESAHNVLSISGVFGTNGEDSSSGEKADEDIPKQQKGEIKRKSNLKKKILQKFEETGKSGDVNIMIGMDNSLQNRKETRGIGEMSVKQYKKAKKRKHEQSIDYEESENPFWRMSQKNFKKEEVEEHSWKFKKHTKHKKHGKKKSDSEY